MVSVVSVVDSAASELGKSCGCGVSTRSPIYYLPGIKGGRDVRK
jgi:hypothetical protein